ncbi:MAG: hypothetical protein GVY16_11590 [Planctomycetes bacterium]|jgi:hypothetical protein|nr:hypothetical protein [Planctomycetota bacterium]
MSHHRSVALHGLLIVAATTLLGGCASISWPLDVSEHRVGQCYGSYQSGFHNGVDCAGNGGVPPNGASLLGCSDSLAQKSCIGYGRTAGSDFNPNERELQAAFVHTAQNKHVTYAHSVELPFDDASYVVLFRHRRVRSAGTISPTERCIRPRIGVALNPATVANRGGDDVIMNSAGAVYNPSATPPETPAFINCGPNGWCDTVPARDAATGLYFDVFDGSFYYRDGGDAEYDNGTDPTNANDGNCEYATEPENGAPDGRSRLSLSNAQRFGQLSHHWRRTIDLPVGGANFYHCHFMTSVQDFNVSSGGGYPNNNANVQNPLYPATMLGYDEGYDPLDQNPQIGPLFVKEGATEVDPASRTPLYACGALDLSVEVTDDMGAGQDVVGGGAGSFNIAESHAWPNSSGTVRRPNRWNGDSAIPFRVEYWIDGMSDGTTDRNIQSSGDPWFIEFRGNPLSGADMNILWDPAHDNGGYLRYCIMLCNITARGYLANHNVSGGATAAIHNDGIWNTKAGDTSSGREWQRGTVDAQFPLRKQNPTHPGWEFPDGVYRLNVKLKDAEDHTSNTDDGRWDIRVDNWAPRIVKFSYEVNVPGITGFRTVYDYNWVTYAENTANPVYPNKTGLIDTALRGYLMERDNEVRVRIQFSESMDTGWAGSYVNVHYKGHDKGNLLVSGNHDSVSWSSSVYEDDTVTIVYHIPDDANITTQSGAIGDVAFRCCFRDLVQKTLDADGNNTADAEDTNHAIDFKPRLERVLVYQGTDGSGNDICVEKKRWKLKDDLTGLELDTGEGESISKWISYSAGNVKIEAEFSEAMADSPSVELLKKDGSWGNLGNLTAKAGSDNTIWEKADLLTKALMENDAYYGKERWFRVTATERKATGAQNLDGVLGTNPTFTPNGTYTNGTWSGYEDEAGNGTTGGKDRNYAVKIDSHAPNLKTRFPASNPAP